MKEDESGEASGAGSPQATGRRVVFATVGSLGDLHPYMAVGRALQARGHRAAIATSSLHRERIEAAGLEFRPMRPDAPEDPQLWQKVLDRRRGPEFVFREVIMGSIRESFADLRAATADADLLVSGPTAPAAPLVAETSAVPWVSSVLQPMALLSVHDPPVPPHWPALDRLRVLGAAYGCTLRGLARLTVRSWTAPYRALRASLGLPRGEAAYLQGQHSPRGVLAMFSRVLGEPQPDWPPGTWLTGFAFFDEPDAGRSLAPQVREFLAREPAPLVFTLGSTAAMDPGAFWQESILAAQRLRQRALLLVGGDGARLRLPEPLPAGVLACDYAPYAAVFPHAALVVHQGGIGTLSQALRAGRRQLVVPFAHDQPDNAARAVRLGVARSIPRERFTAAAAARALRELLADERAAAAAAAAARQISREDGVAAACDALERVLARAPAARPRASGAAAR